MPVSKSVPIKVSKKSGSRRTQKPKKIVAIKKTKKTRKVSETSNKKWSLRKSYNVATKTLGKWKKLLHPNYRNDPTFTGLLQKQLYHHQLLSNVIRNQFNTKLRRVLQDLDKESPSLADLVELSKIANLDWSKPLQSLVEKATLDAIKEFRNTVELEKLVQTYEFTQTCQELIGNLKTLSILSLKPMLKKHVENQLSKEKNIRKSLISTAANYMSSFLLGKPGEISRNSEDEQPDDFMEEDKLGDDECVSIDLFPKKLERTIKRLKLKRPTKDEGISRNWYLSRILLFWKRTFDSSCLPICQPWWREKAGRQNCQRMVTPRSR